MNIKFLLKDGLVENINVNMNFNKINQPGKFERPHILGPNDTRPNKTNLSLPNSASFIKGPPESEFV